MLCKLVWCVNLDSLAAVEPVSMKFAVVPSDDNRTKTASLDAVRPVSSLECACGMHLPSCCGVDEVVRLSMVKLESDVPLVAVEPVTNGIALGSW